MRIVFSSTRRFCRKLRVGIIPCIAYKLTAVPSFFHPENIKREDLLRVVLSSEALETDSQDLMVYGLLPQGGRGDGY